MNERLKWMRADKGFVAFPEGPSFPARRADLREDTTKPPGNQWQWVVSYDGVSNHGWVADRQAASDETNRMWPAVRERAREVAIEQRAKDELEALVERQYLLGTVPLDQFDIAGSSSDRLRSIISIASRHWTAYRQGIPPTLQPLIAACSAELYRRRTGQ